MEGISDHLRAVLFVVLAVLILFLSSHYLAPPVPPQKPGQPAQTTAASPQPTQTSSVTPSISRAGKAENVPVIQAAQEKIIAVESALYRVEFSNRGGVVRSWKLKKYFDYQTPPRPLDLVNSDAAQQLGWPFSLLLSDAQLEAKANSVLYEVTPKPDDSGTPLSAPAEISFHWSDGHLDVTKKLQFNQDYQLSVEASVTLDGKALPVAIAWHGGFGDKEVPNASQLVNVFVFYKQNGKLNLLPYKKLGVSGDQIKPFPQPGPMEFLGIEDQFFTATFIPDGSDLSLWHWTQWHHSTAADGKAISEPEAEMAAGSTSAAPLRMRVFVGPKDLAVLESLNPPLAGLINFGWFEVIAKPLFYGLKWIHTYVPNYGWAIVLLTLALNMPLFPFKMMSWRSMQKMQRVAPEVRSIQDRYKKYSMSDPRKQKMNEEVMAVYKREGVNPMMSCLPMLVQMPILFGFYRVLQGAIELRHAPWIGWVHDLSAKDPYFILPIAMVITSYLMTKMTPQTTTDPAQQKMMAFMPLMFGFIFISLSSGLNLYYFTSNLVGMGQQVYLNKTEPLPSRSKFKNKPNK